MNDSLNLVNKISQSTYINVESSMQWIWISIVSVQFIVILLLLFRIRAIRRNHTSLIDVNESMRKARESEVDMHSLIKDIAHSKNLYKDLSRKCHPDRFQDPELKLLANEIFQEVSKNKRSFSKLTELKTRAINELNLNFE